MTTPVSEAEAREVTAATLATHPPAEPREGQNFLTTALRYAQEVYAHRAQHALSFGSPILLVCSERPSREPTLACSTPVPNFRHSVDAVRDGRVFVVSQSLSGAYELPGGATTSDHLAHRILASDLGSCETAMLDGANTRLVYFPKGVSAETLARTYDVAFQHPAHLTASVLETWIERFASSALTTPQGGYVIWRDAEQHVPCPRIERTIQAYLVPALKAMLFEYVVTPEFEMVAGRADIVVAANPAKSVTGVGVAELKVLCSRRPSQKKAYTTEGPKIHAGAVREGITQAKSYRVECGADFSIVCCFDLRIKKQSKPLSLPSIKKMAASHQVTLHSYPVYPSAKTYRNAQSARRSRSKR